MHATRSQHTIRRLTRSTPFAVMSVLIAACTVQAAGDDDDDDDGVITAVQPECNPDLEGVTRCSDTVLEQCQAGDWAPLMDCLEMSMACQQPPDGAANCYPANVCRPDEAGSQRCSQRSIIEECNGTEWVVVTDCSQAGEECVVEGEHFVCQYVPPNDCGTVTDDQGNEYGTVLIGDRCWMRHNITIGTQITDIDYCTGEVDCFGSPVCAQGQCTGPLDGHTIHKWCQDNHAQTCESPGSCGGMYRHYEIMQGSTEEGARGICPAGWHIPTRAEWQDVRSRFWGNATDLVKYFGSHDFEAILCGHRRDMTSNFEGEAQMAYFWTSSAASSDEAYVAKLGREADNVDIVQVTKNFANSVRCIRDE